MNKTLELLRKELGFTFKEQEDFFEDLLQEHSTDPAYMSLTTNEDFIAMEKTVFYMNWLQVVKELNDKHNRSYRLIKSELTLFDTREQIEEFIKDKIRNVQQQLQNNHWHHLVNLNDFHLILNSLFIDEIFEKTFSLLDGKLHQWQTEINPYQKYNDSSIIRQYRKIAQKNFFTGFAELLQILSEAKLLQILRRSLPERQKKLSTTSYYPLVFKNKESYQFFLLAIEQYQKPDVTKTLLSKYFEFFKADEFILEKVKPKNFFHFVQKELKINMTRLEPYASKEDSEKEEYESMKQNFFPE